MQNAHRQQVRKCLTNWPGFVEVLRFREGQTTCTLKPAPWCCAEIAEKPAHFAVDNLVPLWLYGKKVSETGNQFSLIHEPGRLDGLGPAANDGGKLEFTDADAAGFTLRFYRVALSR